MNWIELLRVAPNAVVAIAAIWLMVQFRNELALNRKEIAGVFQTFLDEAREDRQAFISIAKSNGENIARIKERIRVIN